MEKRALIRNRTQMSVSCSSLSTCSPAAVANGTMLNCSCGGTCIELNRRIQEGNIVMIKATGWTEKENLRELPEGFRMVALAEVKWSKQRKSGTIPNYATGLRYLSN